MFCPNCSERFRLVADYASHLQACRPADARAAYSAWLLEKLNAATEGLDLELAFIDEEERAAALVA